MAFGSGFALYGIKSGLHPDINPNPNNPNWDLKILPLGTKTDCLQFLKKIFDWDFLSGGCRIRI